MLYQVHLSWVGFELTTLVVIGTDCIDSYKSNYHYIFLKVWFLAYNPVGIYDLQPLWILVPYLCYNYMIYGYNAIVLTKHFVVSHRLHVSTY